MADRRSGRQKTKAFHCVVSAHLLVGLSAIHIPRCGKRSQDRDTSHEVSAWWFRAIARAAYHFGLLASNEALAGPARTATEGPEW